MSGLLNTSITEPAFTSSPECATILSTCPSKAAGIQIMSSGSSWPRPRRSITIGPRFTASIHTVARSTVGAAGFSSISRQVTRPSPAAVSTR